MTRTASIAALSLMFCATPPAASGGSVTEPHSAPTPTGEAASIDHLVRAYRWDEAVSSLRQALERNPDDAEAWRDLGRLLHWQGRPRESVQAYQKAAQLDPDDPDAVLGIAAAQRIDRNFRAARQSLAAASTRWPDDADVARAAHEFQRQANPGVHAFYEDDLSFRTRKLGAALPFLSRNELLLEAEEEERPGVYTRDDRIGSLQHHFGINHSLELRVRQSDYSYDSPVGDFAAIDTFEEYRIRYTRPLAPRHVITARYAHRPTTLQVTRDRFAADKVEIDVRSQWTPRFALTLGTGALRDLEGDAASVRDLRTTVLVRAGAEYALTTAIGLAAGYITNPDLDNTIDSTRLAAVSWGFVNDWSALMRLRYDDYKEGDDQTSLYAGLRYSSGSHLWAEFGVKAGERGPRRATGPLVSVIYRF